jgi:hypothetical protein
VNEIGNFQGTKAVKKGPAVVIINSDGDWTITAEGAPTSGGASGASNNGGANASGGASGTSNNGGSNTSGAGTASLPKHCSPGLTATPAISCELASNMFYEYYKAVQNGRDTTELSVWSPSTKQYYTANCSKGTSVINCDISGTTDPNAQVQITQAALDAYTPQHARDYASTHDLGPNG